MKILVVGSFEFEIYSKALFKAFLKLNVNTLSFKTNDFDYSEDNIIVSIFERFQNKFIIGPKIKKINNSLLDTVIEEKPNLVFLYRAVEISAYTVCKIKDLGISVFSYNNDDPFSGAPSNSFWRNYIKCASFCDHNFVYRSKNITDFKKKGINNVSVLKSYYTKEHNYPINLTKTLDVVFIGHYENDGRDYYIKSLIDAGVNINVFGDKLWKKSPIYDKIQKVLNAPVRGNDYNATLNKAKIALVFLSKRNSDTYTRRCFEIPATKTLMLSEYTIDLDNMFSEGKEAVYFNSAEDLVNKCIYLLNNSSLIERIGNAGYKRLLKDNHTVEGRAKEILKLYKNK